MTAPSTKTQNTLRVLDLIRNQSGLTRQMIAKSLNISMPTALHAVEELLKLQLVEESGENASTGGRRAKTLCLNPDSGYGVGIQVTRGYIEIVVTDVNGGVFFSRRYDYPYMDEIKWYRQMGAAVIDVIADSGIDEHRVIGVGISFPGIIDQNRKMLIHSHVFGLRNIELDRFYKSIAHPLVIINDANCACLAEKNTKREGYFYISLNETVGGSLMVNHDMYVGKHWQAGEVGHMILYPEGRSCYCGKKGCSDAYLNTGVLTRSQMDLETFFNLLESGDKEMNQRFKVYIQDLSILISNLRMLLDMDIVLGGELGTRLSPYLERISRQTEEYDLFSRNVDYIDTCRCKKDMFAKGAALAAIAQNYENMFSVLL